MASNELVVNQNILDMDYGVRGPIEELANQLAAEGREILKCHIGNPQAFDQEPLTWGRDILAAVFNPRLLDIKGNFPADVERTARMLLDNFSGHSAGAYSHTKGHPIVRQAVAEHIGRSDGTDAPHIDDIFLTNGASEAAQTNLEILITDTDKDAVLISRPQYSLYSALITKNGGTPIFYDLDERKKWALDRDQLLHAIKEAQGKKLKIKAMVVIDPHNPTGSMLSLDDKEDIIKLAAEHGFGIIADEVYRENSYGGKWSSFGTVLSKMRDYENRVSIIDYHSASKGNWGECGIRGGWMRFTNPPDVVGYDKNLVGITEEDLAVRLCPNAAGQLMIYAMTVQPVKGDPSYEQFQEEKDKNSEALKTKARLVDGALKRMNGVEINGNIGALYRFPSVWLPEGATDVDYAMDLLKNVGIAVSPGTAFSLPGHTRWAAIASIEQLNSHLLHAIEWHNGSKYAKPMVLKPGSQ